MVEHAAFGETGGAGCVEYGQKVVRGDIGTRRGGQGIVCDQILPCDISVRQRAARPHDDVAVGKPFAARSHAVKRRQAGLVDEQVVDIRIIEGVIELPAGEVRVQLNRDRPHPGHRQPGHGKLDAVGKHHGDMGAFAHTHVCERAGEASYLLVQFRISDGDAVFEKHKRLTIRRPFHLVSEHQRDAFR